MKMQIKLDQVPAEQRKKIGNRIRGARIMAGLTQEELAGKYSLSLSTLRNFEIARLIPRSATMLAIIDAIRSEGVRIDEDWIVFGKDDGDNASTPSIHEPNEQIELEAEVLKPFFASKGEKPIAVTVKNN